MVEAFKQKARKSQLPLVFRMLSGIVYSIDEQEELFVARTSLKCCNCLNEPAPESFDKLFHVLIYWQERIAQANYCEIVDDVDQATLWKVPPIFRCTVSSATKAIKQDCLVNNTQNLRKTLKKDSFARTTIGVNHERFVQLWNATDKSR